MEGLLHRAIAQHTPTRAVWISWEFVAERKGEWSCRQAWCRSWTLGDLAVRPG